MNEDEVASDHGNDVDIDDAKAAVQGKFGKGQADNPTAATWIKAAAEGKEMLDPEVSLSGKETPDPKVSLNGKETLDPEVFLSGVELHSCNPHATSNCSGVSNPVTMLTKKQGKDKFDVAKHCGNLRMAARETQKSC